MVLFSILVSLIGFPAIAGLKEIHGTISRFIHSFNAGECFCQSSPERQPASTYKSRELLSDYRFRLSPFLNPVNSTTTNTGTICCAPDFGFLPSSLLSLIRSNHSPAQRPSFPLYNHRGSLNSSLYQSNQVVAWQDGWGSWCYCYPARSNICPALSWH